MHTQSQDTANDLIFTQYIQNTLYIGTVGMTLDEVRVTVAEQCTAVIGGTWSNNSCTLPP